jgi:hypothetical protein
MKIGILTFHSALNVGAVLQAFALQTYLHSMGHETEFINYKPIYTKLNWRSFVAKGIGKTYHKWQNIAHWYYYNKNNRFNSLLEIGNRKYHYLDELQKKPPQYDIYIAGSDQIWNFGFSKNLDPVYLLDFGSPQIKRIAFAASMGQCNQPKELEVDFKNYLLKFDFISAREMKGVSYLQELLHPQKRVKQISDPTFLLNRNQYLEIQKNINLKHEFITSYILPHYVFRSELQKAVKLVKTTFGYDLINLRNPDTCIRIKGAKEKVVTPEQWLYYMGNSKFNICCSFHAVVFSLIFHVPFIVISPYVNNRIESLLKPIHLLYRCVYEFDQEFIQNVIQNNIDWSTVDQYFMEERKKSIDFLNNSIR